MASIYNSMLYVCFFANSGEFAVGQAAIRGTVCLVGWPDLRLTVGGLCVWLAGRVFVSRVYCVHTRCLKLLIHQLLLFCAPFTNEYIVENF
jgi:hypothetical protein